VRCYPKVGPGGPTWWGRPASAPLRLEEVPDSDPADYTLETMRARLDEVGDLTAGMWRRKTRLAPRFKKLDLEPPSR